MRVHIIGPPGSGKTTLARRIARAFDVPAHDLDWIAYTAAGERPADERDADVAAIAASDGWVTEGAFADAWVRPLLERADHIVWLDVPWRVCAWRMVKRHAIAELRRDNRHPGVGRLLRFLRYTRRRSAGLRAETEAALAPFASKTTRCGCTSDVRAFLVGLGIA